MPGVDELNPSNEDWNAYRKLVVETLRRLDERTLDLHEQQNTQGRDIFTLQNKNYDDRFKAVELSVSQVSKDFNEFKSKADNVSATALGRNKLLLFFGAGIWSIATIIVTAAVGHFIK